MAKQVSQETFDGVVRENMEEFEMSRQEAVDDAINQFEAQGVDLSNIVRDLSLTGAADSDVKHPVVQSLDKLMKALSTDPVIHSDIQSICEEIKCECDIDLAHRCLAGKHAAYPTLLRAAQSCKDDTETLTKCLLTFCSLCNGQPDLLERVGATLFVEILKENYNINKDLCMSTVRMIRLTCVKHEENRQLYVSLALVTALLNCLEGQKEHAEVVKEICLALRVLTFDDDIRVPFGKAHDHAKLIVTEAGALSKIMNICTDYVDNESVLGELFSTLASLAVRNEFCREIMDLGGVQLILDTLAQNRDKQLIVKKVMVVIKAVAGNDDVKVAIVNADGAQLILSAASQHIKQASVCELCCAALASIVLRKPEHCRRAMEAGAADVIVRVMQVHAKEAPVQKAACVAIRNLVSRCPQYKPPFLDAGVESLIREALSAHPKCKDDARAALRDLGCQLDLKVEWKGQGFTLDQ